MNIRISVLFMYLVFTAGCQVEVPISSDAPTELHIPEALLMPATEPASAGSHQPLSGEWVERGGVRICDGYLTSVESEDFCAREVPGDWSAFEFEGDVYYKQPLAAQLGSEE